MSKYTIIVSGCDDNTYVDMELSPEELAVIERLAAATKEASTFACEPVVEVRNS